MRRKSEFGWKRSSGENDVRAAWFAPVASLAYIGETKQ
jgi:hypothetical protein